MVLGIHELRRAGTPLRVQSGAKHEAPFDGRVESFDVYVLIPCLNEELVIGATVAALAGGTGTTVIVIDDGSEDRTGDVAARVDGESTVVLRRGLPDARQGKGAALNAAYDVVLERVAALRQAPSRVVLLVMDADGRLSDNAFESVLPLFEEPSVGGTQLAVRIRNRSRNFLTRFQDFQYWTMSAVTQFWARQGGNRFPGRQRAVHAPQRAPGPGAEHLGRHHSPKIWI